MHTPAERTPFDRTGGSLVELVEHGTAEPTELFSDFAARLQDSLGLRLRFARFDGDRMLWLYIDIDEHAAHVLQAPPTAAVSACLTAAETACHRPETPVSYVRLFDYTGMARDTYLHLHMPAIEADLRRALPAAPVKLRYCSETDGDYFIIYDTPAHRWDESAEATSTAICAVVQDYIQAHDPLALFPHDPPIPIITDLETLTRANAVARIIRDNPQMDALERRCL